MTKGEAIKLLSQIMDALLVSNSWLPSTDNPIKEAFGMAIDALNTLSSVQPKTGRWIKATRWDRVYYCDQCRNYLDFDGVNAGRGSTNFCPNCGARMKGEEYAGKIELSKLRRPNQGR